MSNKWASPVDLGGYGITGLGGTFGSTNALNGALGDARYLQLAGGTMTGPALFPLGSAAAPSVTFTGYSDTGMYVSNANTLAWATGGVVRARLSSAMLDLPDGRIQTQVADAQLSALFRGVTMGVRIQHTSAGSAIEAVDHTGVTSLQPLFLSGSTFSINIGGVTRQNIAASGNVAMALGGTAASTALQVGGPIRHATYTVATLPAAGTVGAGTRAAVTDANATTFNAVVAGGGANFVPVTSNGTTWLIG